MVVNDGTDAVSGRFSYAGVLLQEGMVIPDFLGTGKGALITYAGNADGGSVGNDVLLIIINTPPVAVDDAVSTGEDQSVSFDVLTNDTDKENNIRPTLTINLSLPSIGVLTNNHDGTFSYDPTGAFDDLAVGESATVSFEYRVIDEYGDSDTGLVTITVHGANDTPSLSVVSNTVTINEGQTAGNSGTFADIDFTDRPTITTSIGTITQDASNKGAWTWLFGANDGPNQSQIVTITANDHRGGVVTTTFNLLVNNVAPNTIVLSSGSIDENGLFVLNGTFADPGTVDTHTVVIRWGDGSDDTTLTLAAGVTTFIASHRYLDDSGSGASTVYAVAATVTDKDGESGSGSSTVTVNNVAPTVVLDAVTDIDENGIATLSGTITDPGTLDTFTLVIDWNALGNIGGAGEGTTTLTQADLTNVAPGVWAFTATHQYLDDNATGTASDRYTIRVVVTDDDTGTAVDSVNFVVSNVAPVITAASTDAASLLTRSADKTVVLNGTFTDVGSRDTHKVVVNWGDGTPSVEVTVNAADSTFTGSHTYATGGIFKVTVKVIDDDGGSVISTTNAVVEGVGVVNGTLYIIGTDGRDHVQLKQDDKKGTLNVDVKLNQSGSDGSADRIKETFAASTISHVVAFLFDGNDHYDGGSDGGSDGGNDAIPQMVFGGIGDDHLSGGQGNDALFGGAGNDDLSGGHGADILVGGTGKDKIKGGDGNDLLIGGSLVNDFNDLSIIDDIDSAMAEWATGDLADTFSFLGIIIDDDEKDDLFGEKDDDIIYGGKGDKVKQ